MVCQTIINDNRVKILSNMIFVAIKFCHITAVLFEEAGVTEKCMTVIQGMCEGSRTMVRCAIELGKWYNVKVGLRQDPFLLVIVMDRLTNMIREESS